MKQWARRAIATAAIAGLCAALGGVATYIYDRQKREWEHFWEECG
jgi:uncharacterized membrane protein HdeD (DUF308 family)